MANTHEVLAGVKEYTLELLGEGYRDVAVDAADRAEAQAVRAEAAADNAEVGIRDDTVAKNHLTPGLRGEIDGKADRTEVPTTAADVGARPDTWRPGVEDITDLPMIDAGSSQGDTIVQRNSAGQIVISPAVSNIQATTKGQVDEALAGKADQGHTHTSADITDSVSWVNGTLPRRVVTTHPSGSLRVTNRPTDGSDVANKHYVDGRIQLVTAWPSSPVAGVLYLMEE